MKIKIEDSSSSELHKTLKEQFKMKCSDNGFEIISVFPKYKCDLIYLFYNFDNGLNFHIFKGNILSLTQIEYSGNSSWIRYLFVKNGELVLNLTNKLRTRLSSYNSAIVAINGNENHNSTFTLPVQNNLELFYIEINKLRYFSNTQTDFDGLPQEMIDMFSSKPTENHFLYQSYYSLNISDTYNEIIGTTAEGIIKRFLLESKVLELLWLQTEQYKNEIAYGYDANILRKVDIELIRKAKDFIHNNCEKELTLNLISRSIGTNETKLKVGFKKMFGKTFSEILLSERLTKAKTLLNENRLSIKETANACGYRSVSMFSVRFKERFGFPPSQYQKS